MAKRVPGVRRHVRRRRATWRPVAVWALVVAVLGAPLAAQQIPQTGAPRVLWPQRPGATRPIELPTVSPAPPAQAAQLDPAEFVPDQVLVQFVPDASEADRAAARAAVGVTALRPVTQAAPRLELLTTALAVGDAMAVLRALPQIEFAEPNWIVRRADTSNDPHFVSGALYGMYGDNSTPSNQYGSQAAEAWGKGFTGSGNVYVAVLDEGIDVNHADLADNVWTNPFDPVDGLDNDGNGFADDLHGWDFFHDDSSVYDGSVADEHGTHVAGTIGARGGNGIGVAGVAWNVTLISGKFMSDGNGEIADGIAALDYVVGLKQRHGLHIVATSNSWEVDGYSQGLHEAILRAAQQDILFIAAAGNDGNDNDANARYPSNHSTLVGAGSVPAAGYEAVIAVAAITSSGALASFSNFGATSVDLGAPGSDVLSTLPDHAYGFKSGTSMASPHVAGAAALYKAINPAASASQIRTALLTQGITTGSLSGITATGRRLNVGDFGVAPEMTISDVRVAEGQSGTRDATFTVSVSKSSPFPLTVGYVTSDLTATSSAWHANSAMTIPSFGSASPYPSPIVVPSGLGTITRVTVSLIDFSHTFPRDVDVLLAGPAGQTCVLMSDVGGSTDVVNVTLTFDDSGATIPTPGPMVSGTYKPTNVGSGDPFALAPGGPHGTTLAAFNGTNPEGAWRLFIVDDLGGEFGSVVGGWSLVLSTTGGKDYEPTFGTATIASNAISASIAVPVTGDTTVEASETFKVTLSNTIATLADAEGIATIVNDDFTDVSLAGQVIKAAHLTELRTAINEARAARNLGPYAFTDASLLGTFVRALHIAELRTALDQAYLAAGLAPPTYTDQPLGAGMPIKAAHLAELRSAVVALE